MTTRGKPWIGRVAFALGVLLAIAVVAAGSVPAGSRSLTARLKVDATATGGLAVAPEGRLLATRHLAPGAPAARARVKLLNQTSGPATVLVRATAGDRGLDDLVRLELRAGHAAPLRTTLGALRRWRELGSPFAPHRREPVAVRAWIPGSVSGGHEGRSADVTLEFVRKGTES